MVVPGGATGRGRIAGAGLAPAGRPTDTGSGPSAAASRSGQIGKKTAHHWSGASETIRSKAAATDAVAAVTRSRRGPSGGIGIASSRPR